MASDGKFAAVMACGNELINVSVQLSPEGSAVNATATQRAMRIC